MTVNLVRTQGLGILFGVENGLVVVGPGKVAGDLLQDVVEHLAGGEILEPDVVKAPTHGIETVGHDVLTGADLDPAQGEELMPLGEGVAVDHNLFLGIQRPLFPAVDRVFATFDISLVVVIIVLLERNGIVVFLDAGDDLVVELPLQGLGVLEDGVHIGVLRLQIGDDLGILPFFQPVVIVDTNVTVHFQLVGEDLGNRRLGLSGTVDGGAGGCTCRDQHECGDEG
jgi:hypothetical protein